MSANTLLQMFEVDFSSYDRKLAEREHYDPEYEMEPAEAPMPWTPTNLWEFERLVENRITYRMADESAVKRINEMKQGVLEDPAAESLEDMEKTEYDDILLTINRLWPADGNVLLAAEAKAGKSTLVANMIRSLVDGDVFLNNEDFSVSRLPKGSKICLLDLEMNKRRTRDEFVAQRIRNKGSVLVSNLRGKANSFDITNDEQRNKWIKFFRDNSVHTLIIDPIAPLLAQLGVDESDNFGVTQLFNILDKLKADAGIRDMMVVHHCGHGTDWRPRGASRFKDWPDAIWMIRLEGDDRMDPNAPRLIHAKGRDVGLEVPGRLILDTDNKRLTFEEVANAERADAATNRRDALQAYLYGLAYAGSSVPEAERDRQNNPNSQVPACSPVTMRRDLRALPDLICEHDDRFYHRDYCNREHG